MHAIRVPMPTRAAAAIAATALSAGGILAAATAVSAAPHAKPDATRLSIRNKVVAHGKHHVDAVTGVLRSDGKGIANETIALEERAGTAPRWKEVATGTTNASGAVTFTVAPKVKTQVKLVFAGDATFRASHSNVITLLRIR